MSDAKTETLEVSNENQADTVVITARQIKDEVVVQISPEQIEASKAALKETTILSITTVQPETEEEKKERARNYSFLHRNPDSLDIVEIGDKKYHIPAAIGSSYWAILKVFYENANKPVHIDSLLEHVAKHMIDRNPDEWDDYCNKKQTTVHKKSAAACHVQPIKPWQDRIIGNAKTLTRLGGQSKYGQRLYERGHVLVFGYDQNQKPCFTLHTSLDILNQPKVRAPKTPKVKEPKAAKPKGKKAKVKK